MSTSITLENVTDFARGAAFLGAGGGGDPYIGRLMLEQVLKRTGPVHLMDADDIPDDALVVPAAMMGAPSVMIEKLPNGREAETSLRAIEKFTGEKAYAIIPPEIGGINALLPVLLAAQLGLPVIDADGMGRAFPELQMVTFNVYGHSASPLAITDETGNCIVVNAIDNLAAERLARHIITGMGAAAQICCYPMHGRDVKQCGIRGTLTLALKIGQTIREARERHLDPFHMLMQFLQGTDYYKHCKELFDGRVIDLRRETSKGFTIGEVTLENSSGSERITVQFQNENLAAKKNGKTVAIVPDLVTILDRETAEPITAEGLKYGQRLKVLGISVPPVMRSPEALRVFGPRNFCLGEDFQPIENIV